MIHRDLKESVIEKESKLAPRTTTTLSNLSHTTQNSHSLTRSVLSSSSSKPSPKLSSNNTSSSRAFSSSYATTNTPIVSSSATISTQHPTLILPTSLHQIPNLYVFVGVFQVEPKRARALPHHHLNNN
eukprot:m.72466 g.72466  ORF g.72466 m.72466 type:complete len:128 (-) comp8385_c0_seq2:3400-3783(-)